AEFHGDRRIRCGAYAGIHDERHSRDHLTQNTDVSLVLNTHAAADGSTERHYRSGAGVDQALGKDDVVGSVGQDGKAFANQNARGFERSLHVWVERGLIADHFELHPVGESDFAAEARSTDRFVGRKATGGVGKQEISLGIDVVEQRFLAAVQVDAPYGDGDHVGSASLKSAGGFLEGFVFSRTDDQARAEGAVGDMKGIG